ncbi:MAG: Unknown protein [uncultured Thiotrichaceae bacterium]|uniref:Uncharacterized protein n=1 Tax=uncultured Thiotrichaceae bacterium TaxID=298394 RepID=A0A6S6TC12_9GAMM|nr:MAG: Unknown protein [uncultured Thiotrichaceae bacterium]
MCTYSAFPDNKCLSGADMTIIKNRRFLSAISFAVCCAGTAYSSASYANTPVVTTVLDEAPPPWDGQIRPSSAAVNRGAGRTASGVGVAEWYQQRMSGRSTSGADVQSLQAAANAGDVEALYRLGLLYQSGQGVPADYGKAQQFLERAARSGHAYAQYALALLYRQSGAAPQIQQSIQWQQKAAQQGHVEAQYGLGMLYANGQHVAKDLHVARHWLQQASQRNHTMAGFALQDLAVAPRPVAKPVQQVKRAPVRRPVQQVQRPLVRPAKSAIPQVQRPAPQVQPRGASAYAQYAESPVTTTQPVPALTPAPVVAQQPVKRPPPRPVAKPMQQVSTVEMQQSQVRLEGKSSAAIRRAAQGGDAAAQMMYGAMFEDGAAGVKQDSAQALSWYLKAARQGYPKAQHNLALLYEDGKGVKQDYRQAATWYEKAAAAGFSEAQNNLAVLYILGNGVDADRDRAEQLLRQSVAQGNVNAKRNLDMLVNGEG